MKFVDRSLPCFLSRYIAWFISIGCWAVACPCQAAEDTLPTDGLSFHLPFEDSLEAVTGGQRAPVSQKDTPLFQPGKIGQAFRTGAKDSFVIYDAESNMRGGEGTISLWIRPRWEPTSNSYHMFWQMRGAGRFNLYRSGDGKKLTFLYQGKGVSDVQFNVLTTSMDDWKANEWHHVAVSWRAAEVCLYVDGVLKNEVTDPNMILPETSKGSVFLVGDPYHPGFGIQEGMAGVPDTDLDELRLYNRALNAVEIRALAGKSEPAKADMTLPPPHVIVPKTTQPPVIDGNFSFDEWKDAAGFTGFIDLSNGTLAERQTSTLLTYDDDNLYIATFAPLPGGAELKSSVDRRDGPTYGDDSIEIYLDPANARVQDKWFQFIGNPTGYFLDLKNGDSTWNGDWKYKSASQGNWRGFGHTYWVTELAVPFKTLDRATPIDGEKWAANFARSWYTPDQLISSWAWIEKTSYGVAERFGVLEFQEDAPAFQWITLRDFNAGQPTLEGTTRAAAPLHLQVGTSERQIVNKELPSDKKSSQFWLEQIDLGGAGRDTLSVEARSGDKLLYSAQIPYRLDSQAVRVLLSPVPSRDLLLVDADPLRFRPQWQDGGKMEVRLIDMDGKVFGTQQIAPPATLPARTQISLRAVPVGAYHVEVAVQDRAGKTIATQNTDFTKPRPAVWLNNKIGITDKVLKPWTPIKADTKSLGMWGRDYQFDGNALPQQVMSAGKNLLHRPTRLMIDGKALAPGTFKFDEKSSARVVRSGTSQSGAWQVNWKCTAEYDGMLWYEVTLTPRAGMAQSGKPAMLQSLSLELPLRNDASNLYHVSNGPFALGGGESGATPTSWNGGWRQVFWLGNEAAGLSWFTESDEHWKLKEPSEAIRFTRDKQSTLARVQFVNTPLAVSKPITYRFGLQATPTRPLPNGWRVWQQGSRGNIIPNDPIKPTHSIAWWMHWSPLISSPLDTLPDAAQLVEEYHRTDSKVIPYQGLLTINEKAPDFDYFKSEWLTQPRMDGGGEAGQQTWFTNVKGSFQDYFLYAIREMVRKQKWDGMYFDFAQGAVPDRNEFHGSGYTDEKGVRHPTYDILAQREFHKRLWAMLQEEVGTDEPIVMIHNSQCIMPPVHSFANIYYDGEQFNFSPKMYDDYTKIISRETFRAEFLGSNFGGVPMFLPEINPVYVEWQSAKTELEKAAALKTLHGAIDSMLLFTLTHGTTFSPEYMDQDFLKPLRDARDDFNLGEARFSGYWENKALVTLASPNADVLASLYMHDDRLWLEVGNWTDKEQGVTAKLNLAKISPLLKAETAVTKNIWKDGAVTRDGDNWTFTVPPKSARIIEIRNP